MAKACSESGAKPSNVMLARCASTSAWPPEPALYPLSSKAGKSVFDCEEHGFDANKCLGLCLYSANSVPTKVLAS